MEKSICMNPCIKYNLLKLAQMNYLNEICGYILTSKKEDCHFQNNIEEKTQKNIIYPIANIAENTKNEFFMNPSEQILAFNFAMQGNMKMDIIYHSHPNTAPYPSDKDIAFMYKNIIYLIISCKDNDIKAFVKNDEIKEIKLLWR